MQVFPVMCPQGVVTAISGFFGVWTAWWQIEQIGAGFMDGETSETGYGRLWSWSEREVGWWEVGVAAEVEGLGGMDAILGCTEAVVVGCRFVGLWAGFDWSSGWCMYNGIWDGYAELSQGCTRACWCRDATMICPYGLFLDLNNEVFGSWIQRGKFLRKDGRVCCEFAMRV